MATWLDNLNTRKTNILNELAAIGTSPDYNIGGQGIQWDAHRAALMKELDDINTLINREAPYEIRTVGW